MEIYGISIDSLIYTSFVDEEVEKYHFGRDEIYSCPAIIK
jgi:hypothetical protein